MPRQTTFAKPGDVETQWVHVDASGQILGRMATKIATVLMGKHRPQYTPHIDTGDYVVVTNASKIEMTGRKLDHKMQMNYSGYPGGLKATPYREVMKKHPERIVEEAVRRMLPKGRLGRQMIQKLKVYAGDEHPHQAQAPTLLDQ